MFNKNPLYLISTLLIILIFFSTILFLLDDFTLNYKIKNINLDQETKNQLIECNKISQPYQDILSTFFSAIYFDSPTSKDLEKYCIDKISEKTPHPTICNLMKGSGREFDCYGKAARFYNNSDLCYKSTYQDKGKCVAELTKEVTQCWNLEEDALKRDCFLLLVSSDPETFEKDLELSTCDNFLTEDFCYLNVALAKDDGLICEKIINTYTKDDCYILLATKHKDNSYCKKIIEERTETLKICNSLNFPLSFPYYTVL